MRSKLHIVPQTRCSAIARLTSTRTIQSPGESSDLSIVHLHGWVDTPDKPFVFATSEYVRHIKTINPWMVVLTQFLATEPFIIIGASLDEVDLEYYLAHRSPATARPDKGPSILVEPFPDSVTLSDCERYGLNLFRGTAEEFWRYLETNVPNCPTPRELVPPSTELFPPGTPNSIVIPFSADFEVSLQRCPGLSQGARFHYGHPPTWSDLADNQDVSREVTGQILNDVDASISGR